MQAQYSVADVRRMAVHATHTLEGKKGHSAQFVRCNNILAMLKGLPSNKQITLSLEDHVVLTALPTEE